MGNVDLTAAALDRHDGDAPARAQVERPQALADETAVGRNGKPCQVQELRALVQHRDLIAVNRM